MRPEIFLHGDTYFVIIFTQIRFSIWDKV